MRMKTRMKKMMTKTNRIFVTLLAMAAALALSLPLTAGGQKLDPHQPYALVFGTIYGPDDRPVQGVKIKMRRDGEKKTVELFSDSHGEFAHRFPAGKADYLVWADLKDKQAAEKTRVKVHVENDERQDLTLHLARQ
jgi:hypothetical protein